jgi:peptidyl-prolyl cis-trans isomerase D
LPFADAEVIQGTTNTPDLAEAAFAADVGEIQGPLAIPRGWMVWQLAEIKPAGIPPFEDVRAEVEQNLRRDLALDRAAERAVVVAERLRAGEDSAVLAEELGTSVVEAPEHRRGMPVGGLGVVPELDAEVFASSAGDVAGPIRAGSRGVLVARVKELQLVDQVDLESQFESIRSRLMAERASQLLRATLNERRRETVVTVNDELMQRFAPQSS